MKVGLRYGQPFWEKVQVGAAEECWLWLGAEQSGGYGLFRGGKLAHRFAYEDEVAPIPPDMTIDHLCLIKLCCNPRHMEIVTRAENARRGEKNRTTRSGGAWMGERTHCKNRHEFRDGSYRLEGNTRRCLQCQADRMERFKMRQKETAQ